MVAVLEYLAQVGVVHVLHDPAGRRARHDQHRVVAALAVEHFLMHPLEELDCLLVEAAPLAHEQHAVDLVLDEAQRLLEVVDDELFVHVSVAEADRVQHHVLVALGHGEVARAGLYVRRSIERRVLDELLVATLVDEAVA